MTPIILRPDQADLKQRVIASHAAGNKNVLMVQPTGGGKSIIISDLALDDERSGLRQVNLAHRNELIGQLSCHIARREIKHSIIAPQPMIRDIINQHRLEFGRSYIIPDARCVVAGVDTLLARADRYVEWGKQIDRWRVDEAHHLLTQNKWGRAVKMLPNALGLGVTASPARADGFGLGAHADGVFHDMIIGPSMRELISIGALCDYEIVCPESDLKVNDSDFDKNGELSPAKGREASRKSKIVGDVVLNYIKYAYGKRAICFATDVETAGKIADNFNLHGIRAASVSAETPTDVRNDYIRRFRTGQLTVLVNVDLFGEGFDVPAVEVVIMARPTGSLAVYLQQFGRALRVLAGKPYGLVIDHVSNWKRHGFPDKPHAWSLDRREKRGAKKAPDPEEIELTVCRGCARPYERFLPACPKCGWSPPLPAGGARIIEQVDGDLVLLDRGKLEELRNNTLLPSPASMAERAPHAMAGAGLLNRQIEKHQSQQRLHDAFAQWAGVQRAKGRSDQESYRRIYLTLGMDMLSCLSRDRTRQEYDRFADIVESWYS